MSLMASHQTDKTIEFQRASDQLNVIYYLINLIDTKGTFDEDGVLGLELNQAYLKAYRKMSLELLKKNEAQLQKRKDDLLVLLMNLKQHASFPATTPTFNSTRK